MVPGQQHAAVILYTGRRCCCTPPTPARILCCRAERRPGAAANAWVPSRVGIIATGVHLFRRRPPARVPYGLHRPGDSAAPSIPKAEALEAGSGGDQYRQVPRSWEFVERQIQRAQHRDAPCACAPSASAPPALGERKEAEVRLISGLQQRTVAYSGLRRLNPGSHVAYGAGDRLKAGLRAGCRLTGGLLEAYGRLTGCSTTPHSLPHALGRAQPGAWLNTYQTCPSRLTAVLNCVAHRHGTSRQVHAADASACAPPSPRLLPPVQIRSRSAGGRSALAPLRALLDAQPFAPPPETPLHGDPREDC
jgi:hypothetical protein